jgi:hypothetical protein
MTERSTGATPPPDGYRSWNDFRGAHELGEIVAKLSGMADDKLGDRAVIEELLAAAQHLREARWMLGGPDGRG